ncbi:MAG TPA: hypothetical protein VJS38_03365, partial [Phenylobacterium sp.]|nr:hypothetical protein [Phenylobacterium sp.]
MPDGNFTPRQPAETQVDRRGPMRPAQLTSPRDRMSGKLLARAFMAADAAMLLSAAVAFQAFRGWERPEAMAGALLAWTFLAGFRGYAFCRQETGWRHLVTAATTVSAGLIAALALGVLLRPQAAWTPTLVWAAGLVAAVSGLHACWFQVVARFRAQGKLTPNIVIVGATPAAER